MESSDFIAFIMIAAALGVGIPFLGIVILFIINAKLKNNGEDNDKDKHR